MMATMLLRTALHLAPAEPPTPRSPQATERFPHVQMERRVFKPRPECKLVLTRPHVFEMPPRCLIDECMSNILDPHHFGIHERIVSEPTRVLPQPRPARMS